MYVRTDFREVWMLSSRIVGGVSNDVGWVLGQRKMSCSPGRRKFCLQSLDTRIRPMDESARDCICDRLILLCVNHLNECVRFRPCRFNWSSEVGRLSDQGVTYQIGGWIG